MGSIPVEATESKKPLIIKIRGFLLMFLLRTIKLCLIIKLL